MSGPNPAGFTPQVPPGYAPPPLPPPGYAYPPPPKSNALKIVLWIVGGVLLLFFGMGVLGGVAFVFVMDKPDKVKWVKAQTEMGELAKGLAQYRLEHSEYPASLAPLAPYFSGQLPKDPFSKRDYDYVRTPTGYRLTCLGKDQAPGGAEIPERDIIYDERGFHGGP